MRLLDQSDDGRVPRGERTLVRESSVGRRGEGENSHREEERSTRSHTPNLRRTNTRTWVETRASGTIGRAHLDGSSPNQNFIVGANVPHGVAVDSGHIYWVNNGSDAIGRANLDGSSPNQNFIVGASNPFGVAVDAG
jgi:hypothetical protein